MHAFTEHPANCHKKITSQAGHDVTMLCLGKPSGGYTVTDCQGKQNRLFDIEDFDNVDYEDVMLKWYDYHVDRHSVEWYYRGEKVEEKEGW